MTFKLGLTGSIGMGKSTTARIFAEEGCDVWDADAAVHRLYAKGGEGVEAIREAFPEAVIDGAVSRDILRDTIQASPDALKTIERIVHPLVAQDRSRFLERSKAEITVLDMPLLFETGADKTMDAIVCVTVSPDIQRQRVMDRGTLTEEQFETILAKQMPDAEKKRLADFVITTDSLEHARSQVQDILSTIRQRLTHA